MGVDRGWCRAGTVAGPGGDVSRRVAERASALKTRPHRGGLYADRFGGNWVEALDPVPEEFFHGRAWQSGAVLPDDFDRAMASLPRVRAVADPLMTTEETPVPAYSMCFSGARFRPILPFRGDALALLTPQLPSGLAAVANGTQPNLPGRPSAPRSKTATR